MIETDRLLIRPSQPHDAEDLLAIHRNPDVTKGLGGPIPQSNRALEPYFGRAA